jgi:hypothetical protein
LIFLTFFDIYFGLPMCRPFFYLILVAAMVG